MDLFETEPSCPPRKKRSQKSGKLSEAAIRSLAVRAGKTSSPVLARSWSVAGPVMGLDLSLRGAGVAVLSSTGQRLSLATLGGELQAKKGQPVISDEQRLRRMLQIALGVVRLAREHQVQVVGVEEYSFNKFSGSSAVTSLAELGGVVKSQLWLSLRLVPLRVPRSQAMNEILGAGKLEKEDVVKFWERSAVQEQTALQAQTVDEAEALTVAHWAYMRSTTRTG
jgi:Holliday junction resolvasome RuvABC endonuclease subunit